jgi:transcriptional regulator with XRE-family HTH domain
MAEPAIDKDNKLRDIRKAKGFTQAQAADLVGISRSKWSFLECRQRPMTVPMLNLIQERLELTPEEVDQIRTWWGLHRLESDPPGADS